MKASDEGRTRMLDGRKCAVNTAAGLNTEIGDIFALDLIQRSDEICGTLYIDYSDESVKQATLVPALESRGVVVVWRKRDI
jgi:hypothetical protein